MIDFDNKNFYGMGQVHCSKRKSKISEIQGRLKMKNCEKCRFKGIYDKNPKSFLGRIWKWHIGWCPGWKSYVRSLPDEERDQLIKHYRNT